ncbi:MAG: M23 family metallopeptidase [Marinifilaceae bacterium]|jgi:murein DD-endopeptidase MepM/ murein hydrolase activator NlpD|nr:M23 family metallopeptidase [Marinifilaceae bacterium]
MTERKKKSILEKLKYKYKLTVSNESTFAVKFSFRLSFMNVITFLASFFIAVVCLVTMLIAFTPLREYIPGYPSGEMRKQIHYTAILVDSLEQELHKRDRFFEGIKNVMDGREFDAIPETKSNLSNNPRYQNVKFKKSKSDSLFRLAHEEDERFNLTIENKKKKKGLSGLHFFPPITGMVSSRFDNKKEHFGTDIVGATNDRISAVLDGVVILSEWTLNTGYVIQIQHSNNLISVYKHNSELLKKQGDQVKVGEAIALLGSSGELTTGPHLHFELWHNGKPINPEDYIKF